MPYALQSLLRIRAMREDRASAELSAARQEVQKANEALEERKEDLRQFELTKEERRDRIFNAVMGQHITRDELDLAFEGVARIDEEGALKADNVALATSELKEKEKLAETARLNFVKASKEKMKITEHKSLWIAETEKEAERKQEIELEDFTGKKNTEKIDDSGN